MASDSSVNLSSLFKSAVQALNAIDEPWIALSVLSGTDLRKAGAAIRRPNSDSSDSWRLALEKLSLLENASESAGIISSNDYLDDISTSSLKFLLIPFLFSRLHTAFQGDEAERLGHLQQSRASLIEFFTAVEKLGMLTADERDRVLDESIQVARTPDQKRAEKIARFKAEREAERKLSAIVDRRVTHGYSIDDDEETLRDASLTIVQSAIRKGLDAISSVDQEIEILRFASKSRAKGIDPREKAAEARKNAPATVITGMPPTFKIVNNREEIRKGVFRPSHSLPTYTVEEWGEIEMANAAKKEQEKRSAEIVKARQMADEDSDGDEAANRETMEKRSWDDWRDENNRGSGNTMR